MQIGESISVSIEEPQEPVGDKKPVSIRCILLFDGTGNNKTNIQSRLSNSDFYKKNISIWSKLSGNPKADASYENNFSNIASLDTYTDKVAADGYDITVKVYTEGAGTRDNQSDKVAGMAMGTGVAGIKIKCNKGIGDALRAIRRSTLGGRQLTPDEYFIEKLHIDVMGFSRGAATARYAIHQLLFDDGNTIHEQLEILGFIVRETKVCFAGLFDTVSAHGLRFSDDVDALNLDAVRHADVVVQLVAADEYRKNFSLTNISSACKAGTGIEYYMPGAHSDVGGSYHESGDENFQLCSGRPDVVKRDARQLIDEGWYVLTDNQRELIYREVRDPSGFVRATTKANRSGITNAFCQIPLKLMAKYARDNKVPVKSKLETDANQTINRYPELADLDQNIYSYMGKSMAEYNRTAPLLKVVRNRHLHMSSTSSIEMGPRYEGKKDKRRREREIYDG